MKQLKYILLFFVVIAFSSCLDIEENIVINKDDSGTYSFKIDMAKLSEMMAMMGGAGKSDKPKEKADTTIYLKNYIDTATALTTEEKALFRDGFVRVKIDEAAGEMNMLATCPFKNIKQLADIKNNLMTVVNKFDLMKKAMGETADNNDIKDQMGMMDLDKSGSMPKVGNMMGMGGTVFTASPGKISNIIPDASAFKEMMAKDSALQSMQQMATLMGNSFNFKTMIVLPSEVIKQEGPGSNLSQDKKTVTYAYTLDDFLNAPEKISYKVEY